MVYLAGISTIENLTEDEDCALYLIISKGIESGLFEIMGVAH